MYGDEELTEQVTCRWAGRPPIAGPPSPPYCPLQPITHPFTLYLQPSPTLSPFTPYIPSFIKALLSFSLHSFPSFLFSILIYLSHSVSLSLLFPSFLFLAFLFLSFCYTSLILVHYSCFLYSLPSFSVHPFFLYFS